MDMLKLSQSLVPEHQPAWVYPSFSFLQKLSIITELLLT